MKHALLIALAFGLAACAASPSADQAPDMAFALGADLSCNASEAKQCPSGGCAPGVEGEAWLVPISLQVPNGGGDGRFCIATGCEDALYIPMLSRAPGWTALMRTNDRTTYNAELEINRDLRTFTLRQGDSEGTSTWTGSCSPAGS